MIEDQHQDHASEPVEQIDPAAQMADTALNAVMVAKNVCYITAFLYMCMMIYLRQSPAYSDKFQMGEYTVFALYLLAGMGFRRFLWYAPLFYYSGTILMLIDSIFLSETMYIAAPGFILTFAIAKSHKHLRWINQRLAAAKAAGRSAETNGTALMKKPKV